MELSFDRSFELGNVILSTYTQTSRRLIDMIGSAEQNVKIKLTQYSLDVRQFILPAIFSALSTS